MTRRINARLDPNRSRKIAYLRQRTGKSTSEVIKASLDAYFDQLSSEEQPAQLLADLVGCANGPTDLSSDYKTILTSSLRQKGRR